MHAETDDSGPELLAQAMHAAAAGDALIAPSVTARLLATFADIPTTSPAEPVHPLTDREEEVLLTVARGRTNAEIADDLAISMSTVKTHLASLMMKLGARNRVELAMWAYETKPHQHLSGRTRRALTTRTIPSHRTASPAFAFVHRASLLGRDGRSRFVRS